MQSRWVIVCGGIIGLALGWVWQTGGVMFLFTPSAEDMAACENRLNLKINEFEASIAANPNRIWPDPENEIIETRIFLKDAKLHSKNCKELDHQANEIDIRHTDSWKARKQARMAKWTATINDTGPEIGDFVLNGVIIRVPRNYIWLGRNEGDGAVTGLNLLFHYPDMEAQPITGLDKTSGEVAAFLQPTDGYKYCDEDGTWCVDYAQYIYLDKIHCRGISREACNRTGPGRYDKTLNMNVLWGMIHYRGSLTAPNYWFHGKGTFCTSYFMLHDVIAVEYYFDCQIKAQHDGIRKQLMHKLQSFVDTRPIISEEK